MVDVFQERFRELPIFQRYFDILMRFVPGEEWALEELAAKLLIASENGLSWDTLCQNCGVLMDDNYRWYSENEALREENDRLKELVARDCINPDGSPCDECDATYEHTILCSQS